MASLSPDQIRTIIERVEVRLGEVAASPRPAAASRTREESEGVEPLGEGIHRTIADAVGAARRAQAAYAGMGLARRHEIVDSIRRVMLEHAEDLALRAHTETGLGRYEDKVTKNRLVTAKAPGPEDLEPTAQTGDEGMVLVEWAPVGLVGAITPTTNPTSTIINNTISVVSAGNAVVFNVHPNAKRVSAYNVKLLNQAITAAGGPPDLVTAIPLPTIESAKELMHHPDVRVLLVTGGPGVVAEALKTDKRAVAAGPGNPPVVVDETADVERAGRAIVAGGSFDNNIICTDEKEVIAVASIAERLVHTMGRAGAYVLKEHELRKLERIIFTEMGPPGKPGRINPAWIGQNAAKILGEIGVTVPDDLRLIVAEVPVEHPLVWTEQMMPVMPVVRVPHVDAAIDLAVRAEHGFRHTAGIHSTNVDTITRMAQAMNCSIFVSNGSFFSGLGEGGEGYSSFSIASPTGDGLTRPRTFSRPRRVTMVGSLRVV